MPIEQIFKKSTVYKNMSSGSSIVKTDSHMPGSFFEKAKFWMFQLNMLNKPVFMHKIKYQTAPKLFQNKFRKPIHKYPTSFSTSNYNIPPFKLSKWNVIFVNRYLRASGLSYFLHSTTGIFFSCIFCDILGGSVWKQLCETTSRTTL